MCACIDTYLISLQNDTNPGNVNTKHLKNLNMSVYFYE